MIWYSLLAFGAIYSVSYFVKCAIHRENPFWEEIEDE